MPEGSAVPSILFCFGIAQKKGEIPNAAWKENHWVLFPPAENPCPQNFSHMKRDTFFSSLPTLLHSCSHSILPAGAGKMITQQTELREQQRYWNLNPSCGFIGEIDAFASPSLSPCMTWWGSSFSFPVCLSSPGGCSSPAPCSQLLKLLCEKGGSAACICFCEDRDHSRWRLQLGDA